MSTKEKILEFMREKAYRPLAFKEMVKAFSIPPEQRRSFRELLGDMVKEGLIVKTRRKRYGVPERMNLVVGRLERSNKGFGFVVPDDPDKDDVYISLEDMNGAMHNDRVIARISKPIHTDKKAEGEIIRILSRANRTIVGSFESSRHFGFVIPDDPRIYYDVYVAQGEINGAKNGQKVVVEILQWPERGRNPEGRIIEIIGFKDDPGTEIVSIMRKHELSEDFPQNVLEQAEKLSEKISSCDLRGRKDFRGWKIITIDGADARDLDDAVSIKKLENGNYLLGVHIADVSYYVKENTPLDVEARERGCSVYLVDRVIPMLPRKLSNGICSLNPGVDRLTMSVLMEIDKNAQVVNYEITPSIINSKERMIYDDVTAILEGKDETLFKRYDYLIEDFRLMEELCKLLKKKRKERGSIDFDFPEPKVILDEKGKPVEIEKLERTISHKIIEEFMLMCNEVIAQHMHWLEIPFVYRVHEEPDPEKIMFLNRFLHNMGYSVKGFQNLQPKALQQVVEMVKGKKEERIISTVLLRSLKQAKYSASNLGHFGLATRYYSHFTSPIRRYPDLVIHRIIKEVLDGGISLERQNQLKKKLIDIAKTSSERERLAEEAERESVDLKKVEFMVDKIGEEYEGIISSINSFGMFVELDNTVEGLVHVSTMIDDYYHFDENKLTLTGERNRKVYKIGEPVKVRVINANISRRQIDFELVTG